ncbi:MAG: trigger factor, partial [Paludibacteraceae bacterium]|nr:trigger factor [Paludibacteraceae bacterium]
MNIIRTDIDAVNAMLTLQVTEADYAEKVEKALKSYRQKANIPGFRPGMAPMSLVKKMYGKGVKADELNNLLQQELYKYIADNKLDILGEPLPNKEDEERNIDFATETDFEFKFDIALAPEFEATMNKKDSIKYYNITISDEMVDAQVKQYAARFGSYTQVEEAKDAKDMLKGTMLQLDAEGNVVEGGIRVEDAVLSSAYMKDDEQKAIFADAKVNSVVRFNPRKAFENEAEISSMLKITKEEAAEINCDFQYEILSITHYEESAIDESLFNKVYGEGTVKTEEEFRAKVAEGIKESYKEDSEYKFGIDAKAHFTKKLDKLTFPEAFLKRWVLATNPNMTEETVEKDFNLMLEDLKWYLFKNK